jgi:hypothetical protein
VTLTRLALKNLAVAPVPVLAVSGRLSLPQTPPLMRVISAALEEPPHVLVCDVSGLTAPRDGWLLTAFPAALRRAGGWPQACLHLTGAGPELLAAFRRSRLSRYVTVDPTVEDAVEAATSESTRAVHHITLPAHTASVRQARAAVRDLAPGPADPEDVMDGALLVATELVTNSVVHVGWPFTLSLARGVDDLLVAVTDGSRDEPILRPRRPDAMTGRGLQLVAGISQGWGVRLVHPKGKTVWATVAHAPSQPAAAHRQTALDPSA